MKKIILLNPRNDENESGEYIPLPLDLLSIAQPLIEEKYDVRVVDAKIDSIEEIIKSTEDAFCVGIKIFTGSIIKFALEIAKKIKEKNPNIPLVWGGWHASILPLQTIENKYVDIVVKGWGEKTFLELVKRLEKKKSLKNLLGIVYKKDGKIIDNGDRPLDELDLNKYDILPYHLLNMETYILKDNESKGQRGIYYISSRGCPYNCSFCSDRLVYKSRVERSAENTIKDIKYLIDKYKINFIDFQDTNFFINKDKIRKICEAIIKNKWNLKWKAGIRADQFRNLGDDLALLIKKAGCDILRIGGESGSPEVLKLINKQITVEDILACVELNKKYKFRVDYCWVVGFPNVHGKDIQDTLNLIKKIKSIEPNNRFIIFFYVPYPGTPLYPICIKNGFKEPISLEEWSNYNYRTSFIWMTKKDKKKINKFIFYLKLAYPDDYMKKLIEKDYKYKIGHKIALLRFKHNFLKFPIMWNIYYLIKGRKKLNISD